MANIVQSLKAIRLEADSITTPSFTATTLISSDAVIAPREVTTYSDLPAAGSNEGYLYQITTPLRTLYYSDGANWKPVFMSNWNCYGSLRGNTLTVTGTAVAGNNNWATQSALYTVRWFSTSGPSNLQISTVDGSIYADDAGDLGDYEVDFTCDGFLSVDTHATTYFTVGVGRWGTKALLEELDVQEFNGAFTAGIPTRFGGRGLVTISATGKDNGIYIGCWFDWLAAGASGTMSIRSGTVAVRRVS